MATAIVRAGPPSTTRYHTHLTRHWKRDCNNFLIPSAPSATPATRSAARAGPKVGKNASPPNFSGRSAAEKPGIQEKAKAITKNQARGLFFINMLISVHYSITLIISFLHTIYTAVPAADDDCVVLIGCHK